MVSQPDSLSASSQDAAARAQLLDALDADDALDAQATQQLPAADRTMSDLPALSSMRDEPSVIVTLGPAAAPAAPPVAKTHAADATGEIGIEDIVEVAEALAKKNAAATAAVVVPPPVPARKSSPPRSELSEVFGAITPKKLQELADAGLLAAPSVPVDLAPDAPPPQMYAPPEMQMQMEASEPLELRPSSIAPFAVDIGREAIGDPIPARRPSLIVESTAELVRAAGVPSRTTWQTVAGIAGAISLSIVALGLVGYNATHRVKTRTATVVVDQTDLARMPSLEEKRAAAIPPPPALADVASSPATVAAPAEATNVETQVTLVPEPIAATFVPAPPPQKRVAPAIARPAQPASQPVTASAPRSKPAPKGNATPQATGTLRVPTSAVLVDGAPKKVVSGAVTVTCGRHVVKAPMRGTKTIDVPCGGTASF